MKCIYLKSPVYEVIRVSNVEAAKATKHPQVRYTTKDHWKRTGRYTNLSNRGKELSKGWW